VTAASIRGLHDQYGFTSQAKLVVLQCCKAAMDTPSSVASALEYVGVGCVIGWEVISYTHDPGFLELMDLMCNQGKSALQAHNLVCQQYPTTWGTGTRRIGDAELWGEPL